VSDNAWMIVARMAGCLAFVGRGLSRRAQSDRPDL
jgi:hypothetical protein